MINSQNAYSSDLITIFGLFLLGVNTAALLIQVAQPNETGVAPGCDGECFDMCNTHLEVHIVLFLA